MYLKHIHDQDQHLLIEEEIQNHIKFIEDEIKKSKKDTRMLELKNWLDYLKAA